MRELSFLVVHGGVVAKALVAATTAAGLAVVWRDRWRRDAAKTERTLRTHRERITAPVDGDVTVIGTLREEGDLRWLDCAGQRIHLAGELHVVRGTRMTWPHGQSAARHTVCDGDAVIATGKLARTPSSVEPSSYRGDATMWTMTPVTAAQAIELVAARPVVHGKRPGLVWLVVCGLLSYGILFSAGRLALWRVHDYEHERERESADAVPSFDANVLAAALPGARDRALDALQSRLGLATAQTPDVREMRIALSRLGDCAAWPSPAWRLREEDRFEEALEFAKDCDPGEVVAALMALGRYDEAAQLGPRSIADDSTGPMGIYDDNAKAATAVAAAIGAGQWNEAAELADRWVEQLGRHRGVVMKHLEANDATGVICLSELFRARGGELKAIERIHRIAESTGREFCREVEVIAMRDSSKIESLLASIPASERPTSAVRAVAWSYGALNDDLRDEHTPPGHPASQQRLPTPAEMLTESAPPNFLVWLAPFAFAAHDSPQNRRWMAAYHVYVGDFTAARRDVHAFDAQFPAERPYDALDLAIELHLGEPLEPGRAQAESVEQHVWTLAGISKQDFTTRVFDRFDLCPVRLKTAFQTTFPGDGAALASLMAYCPNSHWPSALVLAALPAVTAHRDELREALRGFHGDFDASVAEPLYLAHHAMIQRDVMRLGGDPPAAVRWQAILDRHTKALADHDRVIALMLWHLRGPH